MKVFQNNDKQLFSLKTLLQKDIYADTLYGNEFGSSVWCRTSLLRMIWCTTSNQLVNWHFLATYSVAVLIDTQMKVNC